MSIHSFVNHPYIPSFPPDISRAGLKEGTFYLIFDVIYEIRIHLILNVLKLIIAASIPMIQNRTTTLDSSQPFSSK